YRAGSRVCAGAQRLHRLQGRRTSPLRAMDRPHAGSRLRPADDLGRQRCVLGRPHAPDGAGRGAAVVEPLLLRPGSGAHHAARVRRAPRRLRHADPGRALPASGLHRPRRRRLPVHPGRVAARRPVLELVGQAPQEASAGFRSNQGRAARHRVDLGVSRLDARDRRLQEIARRHLPPAHATFPLMAAVQLICARIGLITGRGLAGTIRRHYPRPFLYVACLLLLIANVFNIAADLAGMADATRMLTGVPLLVSVPLFGLAILLATVYMTYARFAQYLKWLTAVLL